MSSNSSTDSIKIPNIINKRFEIIKQIGSGSFGIVYKGLDSN